MPAIDLYTTLQCGFCQTLKSKLQDQKMSYIEHDITSSQADFAELQCLSPGNLSVPVIVLNKGQPDQKVVIGLTGALTALNLGEMAVTSAPETATLTCPRCGHTQPGTMPTTACVPWYICKGCQKTIEAAPGDCCVYCSYADKPCPLKQKEEPLRVL